MVSWGYSGAGHQIKIVLAAGVTLAAAVAAGIGTLVARMLICVVGKPDVLVAGRRVGSGARLPTAGLQAARKKNSNPRAAVIPA